MHLVILIHECIGTQCTVASHTFNLVTAGCLVNCHCPDLCETMKPSITSLGKDHNSRSKLLFLLNVCGICIFLSVNIWMYSCVREETVVWNNYREALGTWRTIKDIYEVLKNLSWNFRWHSHRWREIIRALASIGTDMITLPFRLQLSRE